MNCWGADGPPVEAYSRVSHPERFRPLHDIAIRLLDELRANFAVERLDGYGIDRELERGDLSRTTVRLAPHDPKAAPLVIAFTNFPGLIVRAGRWVIAPFPGCGCDACAETVEGEAVRLRELVDDVTAGRFRETISKSVAGDLWQEWESWSTQHRQSYRSQVDHATLAEMLAGSELLSMEWQPWRLRDSVGRLDAI